MSGLPAKAPASIVAADESDGRGPALDVWHLIILVVLWFPLNPIVLSLLRTGTEIDNGARLFGMLATTICGPGTAVLEGRNREHCLQFAARAVPVCGGALALAFLGQFLWRPRRHVGRLVRYAIWAAGCFIWFAGAFVSILNNLG
jgi:hypothetical protein